MADPSPDPGPGRDLTHPALLWLKAGLFVLLGLLASVLLWLQAPTLLTAGLITVSCWAFARAYYFCFHVVEHYLGARYRFAGLLDFARQAWSGRLRARPPPPPR